MAAWTPGGKTHMHVSPPLFQVTTFLHGLFMVLLDGLRERETTHTCSLYQCLLPVHILPPFPPSALYTKVTSTDLHSTVYKWTVPLLANPASTHTDPQWCLDTQRGPSGHTWHSTPFENQSHHQNSIYHKGDRSCSVPFDAHSLGNV